MSRLRIEKLSRKHELAAFDCGSEALNRFLTRFALQNQQSNSAQTYLGLDDDTVIGLTLYRLIKDIRAIVEAP